MTTTRPTLLRLLRIHTALLGDSFPSLTILAGVCEVNERTVKRDLRMLREEFGAPLEYVRERGGYHYAGDFTLVPAPFQERELLALSIAVEVANTLSNTPFPAAVQNALQKLQAMLPQEDRLAYDGASAAVASVREPAPPERLETVIFFNDLLKAIRTHQQVRLTYYSMSSDEETVRTVNPYQLYLHRGMWYLHAYCHLRKEERDFAVVRIRKLKILAARFRPPDQEQLRARLANRFTVYEDKPVKVSIWFTPRAARRIRERIWHPSQTIVDHSDGSCTLTMTVDGVRSVFNWILSFGRQAIPVAPAELVKLVNEEVAAMAASRKPPSLK